MIIRILATWRLASLLHRESGPFEAFARFRDLGIGFDEYSNPVAKNEMGSMLMCFWCTSIWAALVVTLLERRFNLLDVLASSGGAILIDQARERWLEQVQ